MTALPLPICPSCGSPLTPPLACPCGYIAPDPEATVGDATAPGRGGAESKTPVEYQSRAAIAFPRSGLVTEVPALRAIERSTAEPSDGRDRSRNKLAMRGLIASLIVAFVAAVGWGWTTKSELDSTKAKLAGTQSSLATTQTALTDERQHSDELTAENASLQAQASRQADCLSELRAEQADLNSLLVREGANFNATAVGSTWAVARTAQAAAVSETIDDYYQAYLAAFNGARSTANALIDKGNAVWERAVAATATMNDEIAKIDDETDALDAALATLMGRVSASAVTCSSAPASTL
jgi:hypothetical protein